MHPREDELVKRFNVTTFPSVNVYRNVENELLSENPIYIDFPGNKFVKDELISLCNQVALKNKRYMSIVQSGNEQNPSVLVEQFELEELYLDDWEEEFKKQENREILVVFTKNGKIPMRTKRQLRLLYGSFKMYSIKCKKADSCKETFHLTEVPVIKHFRRGEDRLANTNTFDLKEEDLIEKLIKPLKSGSIGDLEEKDFAELMTQVAANKGVAVVDMVMEADKFAPNFKLLGIERSLPNKVKLLQVVLPSSAWMNENKVPEFPITMVYYHDHNRKLQQIPMGKGMPYMSFKNLIVNLAQSIDSDSGRSKKGLIREKEIKDRNGFEACMAREYCLIVGFKEDKSIEDTFHFNVSHHDLARATGESVPIKTYSWVNSSCKTDLVKEIAAHNEDFILLHDSKNAKTYLKKAKLNPLMVNKLQQDLVEDKTPEFNLLKTSLDQVDSFECSTSTAPKQEAEEKEEL